MQVAPPRIRSFVPQAPPTLDALFARALAKDPAYRFSSAIEMGNAFRVALDMDDTPAWKAQAEIAREAAEPVRAGEETAHERRLATRLGSARRHRGPLRGGGSGSSSRKQWNHSVSPPCWTMCSPLNVIRMKP